MVSSCSIHVHVSLIVMIERVTWLSVQLLTDMEVKCFQVAVILMLAFKTCECASRPRFTTPAASFVFGDSLVDAGNNNYIGSLARANYGANGVDFPGGKATGRFCNGRTVADIIGNCNWNRRLSLLKDAINLMLWHGL